MNIRDYLGFRKMKGSPVRSCRFYTKDLLGNKDFVNPTTPLPLVKLKLWREFYFLRGMTSIQTLSWLCHGGSKVFVTLTQMDSGSGPDWQRGPDLDLHGVAGLSILSFEHSQIQFLLCNTIRCVSVSRV